MWKVIYIAPSAHVAKRLKDLLTAEGLLVTERPLSSNNCSGPTELLVPKSEAAEAHEILNRAICSQVMNVRPRV
ncbi:MAG TPA: glutamate decarboxylase [Firmicutes bacterium]|nr:glutamate decarboxylase [Bacillota bacterium]